MKLALQLESRLGLNLILKIFLFIARATLEILIPDFVKQTSEEKPKDSEELEVSVMTVLFGTAVLNSACPVIAGCAQ